MDMFQGKNNWLPGNLVHVHTHIHDHTQGREEEGTGRGGRGERKRKRIPDSLSIVGVYLKTVLQVAIETHK